MSSARFTIIGSLAINVGLMSMAGCQSHEQDVDTGPSQVELETVCVRVSETKNFQSSDRIDLLLEFGLAPLSAKQINDYWEDDGFSDIPVCVEQVRYALNPEPYENACTERIGVMEESVSGSSTTLVLNELTFPWGELLPSVPDEFTEKIERQYSSLLGDEFTLAMYKLQVAERVNQTFETAIGGHKLRCAGRPSALPEFACMTDGDDLRYFFGESYFDPKGIRLRKVAKVLSNPTDARIFGASIGPLIPRGEGTYKRRVISGDGKCNLIFEYDVTGFWAKAEFEESYPGDQDALWLFTVGPKDD